MGGDRTFDDPIWIHLLEFCAKAAGNAAEIDFFSVHVAAGDAAEGEQVVDQLAHALGGGADAAQVVLACGIELIFAVFEEGLAEAVDAAQGGAEVMGYGVAEGF